MRCGHTASPCIPARSTAERAMGCTHTASPRDPSPLALSRGKVPSFATLRALKRREAFLTDRLQLMRPIHDDWIAKSSVHGFRG